MLRKVEARGRYETARRLRSTCGMVFRYAIATGRAERDPSADLRGALTSPKTNHRSAIVDPTGIGALLRAIDGFDGQPTTRAALRLAPLVFVRPGELRHAEWAEIDLQAAEWRIPAEKMKMRRPHRVPLSRQALAIIRELQNISGNRRWLFPSVRTATRPISENTLNAALRRLGYGPDQMTTHGFQTATSFTTVITSQTQTNGTSWDRLQEQMGRSGWLSCRPSGAFTMRLGRSTVAPYG